jgi:hypothetical protein
MNELMNGRTCLRNFSRFSSISIRQPASVVVDAGINIQEKKNTMQLENLDTQAIYQAVSDYYDGWYKPDMKRMNRSLHVGLAKRAIERDDAGEENLLHLTKEMMMDATRKGGGSNNPPEKKNWTITILDCYEEIATVKVNSVEYMEYIHLARQDGKWQIVNVLYTNHRSG